MAPYIAESVARSTIPYTKRLYYTYMLNLGWVPKNNKNRIRETSANDVLPLDDLPDHLADDENAPITSTINAYIRVG